MSVRTLALIVLMLLSLPLRPAQADDVEKGEQLAGPDWRTRPDFWRL